MKLSIVIVTHNRRESLLQTLARLSANASLANCEREVFVVDNGSTDGTGAAVRAAYPAVSVIRRKRNEGVSARNHALETALGKYVMLIDDDSYPLGDAAARAMAHLDDQPRCGAVVGRVELPDDRGEASALPGVIINCAVVLRREALQRVGYFPREFFRQAEEYDLSFRLWNAGYTIERFEDLVFRHEKVGGNRWPAWIHRMDVRNNLILAQRYLPEPFRRAYHDDWVQRYTALARQAGHESAARRGRWQATWWAGREALRGRSLVSAAALESIFGWEHQAYMVSEWAGANGLSPVAIADFGKNTFATYRACTVAGLEIEAVVDGNPAFEGERYRGVPIVSGIETLGRAVDGIVLSNINPAQIEQRASAISTAFAGPILELWKPRSLGMGRVLRVQPLSIENAA